MLTNAKGSAGASGTNPQPRRLLPTHLTDAATPQRDTTEVSIGEDLIVGADAVAVWMGFTEKQIYNLHARTDIPVFTLTGCGLAARKSALRHWIAEHEREEAERKRRRTTKHVGGRR